MNNPPGGGNPSARRPAPSPLQPDAPRDGGLPQPRRLDGQGALRPNAPGRTVKLGLGAALPRGRVSWENNDDLYDAAPVRLAAFATAEVAEVGTDTPPFSDEVLTLATRVLSAAEVSDPDGNPASVVVFRDGNGGRAQVTLGIGFTEDSGSLKTVIQRYVDAGGQFADEFRPFIPRIGANPNLSRSTAFKNLLKRAGRQDPLFGQVQQTVFKTQYLSGAVDFCEREGLKDPLSFLVVADSYLHSGGILSFLRRRFPERTPKDGGDEHTWISQYVDVRHRWLANHSRRILRNTIYRTRALRQQIRADNWRLEPPIDMNGISVDMGTDGGGSGEGLQISGSVGVGGRNRSGDVRTIKARLRELGFGGFDDSDRADRGLGRAIQLFQSIFAGHQRIRGDGRVDVGGRTQRWLEADNAPRWQEQPVGDRDGGFFNYDVATQPNDHHDFGTNWLADTITGAGEAYWTDFRSQNPGRNPILVNDASLPDGHDTPDHSGHETGMSVDLRLPNTDGDQHRGTVWQARDYDRDAMRAMLVALKAQPLHKRTLFNDPQLISEGLCVRARGHDNHVHVEIEPPRRQA